MTRTGKDTQEPRPYLSYLLRLWQAGSAGRVVWRASLESVQSGERLAFAGLEALFEYLRAQTSAESVPDQPRFRKSCECSPKTSEICKSTGEENRGGADADGVDPDVPDP